jgi:hypothetical protein
MAILHSFAVTGPIFRPRQERDGLGSTRAKCHSERWSGCRQAARGVVEPNTRCRGMCSGSNRGGSAGSLADIAFPVFEIVDVDLSTTPRRTLASDSGSSPSELIGQVVSAAFRPSSFSSSETIRSTSKSDARCFQAPAVYSGANSSVRQLEPIVRRSEETRDEMSRHDRFEARSLGSAHRLGPRAALVQVAAGWQVDRTRDLAL